MSAKTHKQSGGGRKTAEKPRILYFDILRALAPILVIMVHTVCKLGSNPDFWSGRYMGIQAINTICQVAVPIFVMISGALFLDRRRRFDFKKHFRKYILRLALIYVVWTVIYAVLGYIFAAQGVSAEQRTSLFFSELFGMHHYHMWFILMLLMMYLLVPCLRKITESRALTEYFLMLGIVFCFALPSLGGNFELIAAQHPSGNPAVLGALRGMTDLFGYLAGKLGLKFVIYFVLGHYIHTYGVGRVWRRIVYVLGALGALYAFVFSLQSARTFGLGGVGADSQNINIGILAYSAGLFILIKQLFRRAKRLPKLLDFMAKHSLGVYLVHVALVDFILYRTIEQGSQPLWILLLCTVPIYITSLVVTWAISKLPLLKKVIQ